MRIISGRAKGHPLKTLRGMAIRPTSDLVRGAIFSALGAMGIRWERVLDLYAGSGALGIEALSRGAGWVDFIEQDHRACAIIGENLERTGFAAQARVRCQKVEAAIASGGEAPYGLVLLDPPYEAPSLGQMLEQLAASPVVEAETTIVVEHSRRQSLAPSYGSYQLVKALRHGDTRVSVYRIPARKEVAVD
ncbi:MAG: 16S rRNA (guanine(966)-N(2))-methyltransferase RsmD [Chloroflexi bacterium]|nr:16S rRNA (guanine(966)-N(2))-methyltransferase RsmD [Chloroflexota bacterium]